jgi:hypothetical protein
MNAARWRGTSRQLLPERSTNQLDRSGGLLKLLRSTEPRDLFTYLGERLLVRVEQEPITITVRFADGERTFQLGPKDPLYRRPAKGRAQALKATHPKEQSA